MPTMEFRDEPDDEPVSRAQQREIHRRLRDVIKRMKEFGFSGANPQKQYLTPKNIWLVTWLGAGNEYRYGLVEEAVKDLVSPLAVRAHAFKAVRVCYYGFRLPRTPGL